MAQMHSGAPNRPASMRVCVKTTFSGQSCRRFQSFGYQNEQPILIASLEDDVTVAFAFDSLNSALETERSKKCSSSMSQERTRCAKASASNATDLVLQWCARDLAETLHGPTEKTSFASCSCGDAFDVEKVALDYASGPSGRHVERGKCLFSSCAPK